MRPGLRLVVLALAGLLCAFSSGGCAYGKARGRDFSQIFRFEIGPALAFGFDTRLLGLMDLGLGGGFHWDAGWEYGEGYLGKQETIVAPGVCLRGMGPTEIWSHECPSILPPVFAQERYTQAKYTHMGSLLHEFDLEVDAMAVILHFRFGFSPGEMVDAFAGIFGFDPAGDDGGAKPAAAADTPPPGKYEPPPEGPARPVRETPPEGTEYRKVPPPDTARPPPPPPPSRPAPAAPSRPAPAPSRTAPPPTGGSSGGDVVEPRAPGRRSE